MTTTETESPIATDVATPTKDQLFPFESNDDPSLRAHIVMPEGNEHIGDWNGIEAQDIVDLARLGGLEVVALCGYKWVPKHNPRKKALCPACLKQFNKIFGGE